MNRTIAIAAVLLLSSAPASVALSQPAAPNSPSQPAATPSESELRSFAVVVLGVRRINSAYLPMLQAAGTPEEQQKVVNAAEAEVAQAIQEQGLSAERFHQILAQTQRDDGLADRVRQYMKEETK